MKHLLVAAFTIAATAASGQSLKPDEVLSTIAARPISVPNPVAGADGRVHFAYEAMVENASRLFVTLDKVEVIDEGGRTVYSLEGAALQAMIEPFGNNAARLRRADRLRFSSTRALARARRCPQA